MTPLCDTCGAPLQNDACPFDTDEQCAPWAGDHAALADGRMTHDDHQLSVARWTVHQPPGGLAAIRNHFTELARKHAGKAIACNALTDGDADKPANPVRKVVAP